MIIKLIGCILFLNLQFWAKAQRTTIEGCISYDNNDSNICTQCDEYFELNQQKNVCIYKKCGNSQYYDKYSNIITDDKKCVAICSPISWRNQETNLCQKQRKCSTQINAELITGFKYIKDIFVYQKNYYVVQTDQFIIYDKTDFYMIKALNSQQNDQLVINLNSEIFVISNNNQIIIWDLIKDERIYKLFDANKLMEVKASTKILNMQNQYAFIYNEKDQKIIFQIVQIGIDQSVKLSNIQTINMIQKQIIIIGQVLFIQSLRYIFAYSLVVSNQDENLNIESNFLLQSEYRGDFLDILSTSQFNIYILAQDVSIQFINLNNNQIQPFMGKIDNQNILKAKIFEGFNIDSKEYLIINKLYQLVCVSIETDSQSLIITNDKVINFEIYHIQGNQSQVFAVYENFDLKIFDYNLNLKQFIQIGPNYCILIDISRGSQGLIQIPTSNYNSLVNVKENSLNFSFYSQKQRYRLQNSHKFNNTDTNDYGHIYIPQELQNLSEIYMILNNNCSDLKEKGRFSTKDYPNQQIKPKIIDFQYDYSSRSVIYFDNFGTIYLFSLDKNSPFQSYIQITEITDQNTTLQISSFYYNNITNQINLDKYVIDYDTLGWQYEPQVNEPYNYFSQIVINNLSTDYLIFKKYNNTLFRYSNKILKFELDVSGSTIQDILYNQMSDILIIGLENSLLFYEQYQQSKNNNIYPHIHKFDNIQFQQFISNNLIITCDKKILHLDIQSIQIVNTIQFNLTQQVTSYSLSKNQINLVVGFSNGQVLSYNLINQAYYTFEIQLKSSLNTPINFIQFKTTIDTQSLVYVVSSNAILYLIDTLNNQIIEQIDLKILVNEDPNLKLNKFLFDEAYQRYIFCFIGHKNAYVWNLQKQKQEYYLFMPSQFINKLSIEKNYIFIQCYFQINIFQLDQKIRFLTVIKKNFLKDQITDFKLVSTNAVLISFKKKIELFLINNKSVSLVGQHNYTNPFIIEYSLDIQKNELKIIGFHKAGIFENIYNLDLLQSDQEQSCNLLISSSGSNIKNEIAYIYPIKTPFEYIDGVTLVDKQNQQNNIYLQIQGDQLSSLFDNIMQKKDYQLIVSSKDKYNNILPLQNDTFSNLFQSSLQLANFNFNFQNYTNLLVNVTINANTQKVIFQNISFNFQCFGSNQIIIANVEKMDNKIIKLNQTNKNKKKFRYPRINNVDSSFQQFL
ncbi:hypothetical protein ABPG73_016919 [Tetrahymena malaccensis]